MVVPGSRDRISIPLQSENRREVLLLDIARARIKIEKCTYQTRARQTVLLARLDFGAAPHRNPDGTRIGSPHLHLYKEGFADKWAYPLPTEHFTPLMDSMKMLEDFMRFCNIVVPPVFSRDLFA